jgi:tight adherence protein C
MTLDLLALGFTVIAVVALAAIVAAVVQVTRRRTDVLVERIADPMTAAVDWGTPLSQEVTPPQRGLLAGAVHLVSLLARPARQEEMARVRARLYCAGFRSERAVSTFLVAKVVLAFALLGVALWWNARSGEGGPPAVLIAIVTFAAGYYFPDLVVASRVRHRQSAIERGLADALDLLVTCVEAGLGLDAALKRVAGEVRLAHPVLGEELATTFLEVKAGIPRIEAFRRMAERNGVKDLKSLSATLAQTDMFGTSVAVALRVQAEGIRTRRMHRAEERAGFVAVKMTIPLALCILPALIAIILGPSIVTAERVLPSVTRSQ